MIDATFCGETAGIWRFIGFIIHIIRIAIPIIIILLGTIDLGKAVIAGDDDKIKAARKSFIMRIVYGVAIFFVFPIVETIFGLLGADITTGNAKVCYVCARRPNSNACTKYIDGSSYYEIGDDSKTSTTTTTTTDTRIDRNYNRQEA